MFHVKHLTQLHKNPALISQLAFAYSGPQYYRK